MRALVIVAILGSALIGFATAPADARNISGGASRGHLHIVASRPLVSRPFVSRPFVTGRFVTGLRPNFGSQRFVLDRFSGRLVAFDRRGFARSRRFTPFGLDGFGGFDGFGDFGGFGGFNENPAVVSIPRAATEATQPAPTRIAGDLPPCRETMAGVVINRGGACSRAPLSAGPSTDPPRDVPR